ncbi:hypothetical protein FA13DRAFT_1726979 [Coprinellus micaceus]|uniref:Uncharacterized protein n=1 Tax=Coprinellus micaceus TaxID=71717 RepID=A0A4Y7TR04_COPMI|nr:hypothetical protein FA13DRAFT_1726979 [Coprinellus micaceus]
MGSAQAISGDDNAPECVVHGPTNALTLLGYSGEEAEWVIARARVDRNLFLAVHMMRRSWKGEMHWSETTATYWRR